MGIDEIWSNMWIGFIWLGVAVGDNTEYSALLLKICVYEHEKLNNEYKGIYIIHSPAS